MSWHSLLQKYAVLQEQRLREREAVAQTLQALDVIWFLRQEEVPHRLGGWRP